MLWLKVWFGCSHGVYVLRATKTGVPLCAGQLTGPRPGSASPPAICGYDPSLVPYVLDTIPPSTVDVQTELNPTINPVVLEGVTVP